MNGLKDRAYDIHSAHMTNSRNTRAERDAATQVIAGQPDSDTLAAMLGLDR